MEKWIGLIDCNNFFVSCERLFRPDLRKKPVLVLSSNDGCVVARSQEIKDKGIPMGIPVYKVKDILKDIKAITFSSHFTLYRDISRRVFDVVTAEFEIVEQYSIDEAFFVFEGTEAEAYAKIKNLKDRVEHDVGMPVSVGLAASKTLAKYASHLAKKGKGVCVLNNSTWEEKRQSLPLKDIWGVGYRSADEFKKNGLITVSDLLRLERRQVQALFGVVGVRLWLELQGIPSTVVSPKHHIQHSILHSRSFKHTTTDLMVLKDAVAYHVREASADLRSQGLKTRVLQVSVLTNRHGDFFLQGGREEIVFTAPTNDSFELLAAAAKAVERLYKPGVPYKKAGVQLYDFTPISQEQLTMFVSDKQGKTNALTPLIDQINERLSGVGEVLIGSYLKTKEWESSHAMRSPAYTTSWNDLAVAKA